MQCDMCGQTGDLVRAEIEGTSLTVCKNCAGYGKIIGRVKTKEEMQKEEERVKYLLERKLTKKERFETNEAIATNFSEIIRKKRESLGLKQEELAKKLNEKESMLNHLELGKLRPSIELARKLEKLLGIKLVIESKEEKQTLSIEGGQMTIGDMIKFKKK